MNFAVPDKMEGCNLGHVLHFLPLHAGVIYASRRA